MIKPPNIAQRIKELKCCILIPTYNNEKTLRQVIDGVLDYTDSVILVNDGATDSTATIMKGFPKLEQIHFPVNRGKGAAMKEGMRLAEKLGYDFAITIDSDGQHFPDDIPLFIDALEKEEDKNVLYIGDRNMAQEGIPKKSSFGNRFSSFWFWVETGFQMKDTQSGFRLYPLKAINEVTYYTNRFEFEIEVIVKAAWNGVEVKHVPVRVTYEDDRVSHFRPIKDFARITVLNTWFVICALFYYHPRNYIRKFKKKGFKRFFFEDFLKSNDSKAKKALSIALGVFIGVAPLWGFQSVLSIFFAALFRLNKVISFAFSNVSIPPVIPFIIYASFKMGGFILGSKNNLSLSDIDQNFEIGTHITQYLVGSFSLALIMALLFGSVGYVVLHIFGQKLSTSNG